MHKLRHFYYQNKEKIWKTVFLIVFILGIIYFLNARVGDNQKNTVVMANKEEIYSDNQNKTYISDKSAISGETVTEEHVEKINNTVSKFLQYCKNGNIEQAYNMLSADCKQNEYSTLEKFESKYVKSKFSKQDVYKIENWIRDTYKVSISKDLLSTGDVNSNQRKIEYITIVKENNEEKLNINSYIGQKTINKEEIKNNVKVSVISKKVYMDYEIYDIKIENLSDKTIKLDSFEKTGTMYLEDSASKHYNAYSSEIIEEEIEIKSKHKINLSIKYANTYSTRVTIKSIVFDNVILDYIKYKNTKDTQNFKDICELKVNLY